MNKRDSEALKGLLLDRGFKEIQNIENADIILINTCSVRKHAEDRVFSLIGKLKKLKPPRIVAILGCMAQNFKHRLFQRFPHVNIVCGPSELLKIVEVIEKCTPQDKYLFTDIYPREESFYASCYRENNEYAYIIISTVCSNYCSYCIVPYVRGPLFLRQPHFIIEEIEKVVSRGIRNIILLGQNVNDYKLGNFDFVDLLYKVHQIKGLESIGFLTSHPKNISKRLIQAMQDVPKIKKHLHLPLQSASNRILRLMNRGYTFEEYLQIVELYRKTVKEGTLTTDIIVGFPTESDEDFQQTLKAIQQIEFDASFIFKYSVRPFTQSATLKDDVPPSIKEKRHNLLLEVQKDISKKKNVLKSTS